MNHNKRARRAFCPGVDPLEGRLVLSSASTAHAAAVHAAQLQAQAQRQKLHEQMVAQQKAQQQLRQEQKIAHQKVEKKTSVARAATSTSAVKKKGDPPAANNSDPPAPDATSVDNTALNQATNIAVNNNTLNQAENAIVNNPYAGNTIGDGVPYIPAAASTVTNLYGIGLPGVGVFNNQPLVYGTSNTPPSGVMTGGTMVAINDTGAGITNPNLAAGNTSYLSNSNNVGGSSLNPVTLSSATNPSAAEPTLAGFYAGDIPSVANTIGTPNPNAPSATGINGNLNVVGPLASATNQPTSVTNLSSTMTLLSPVGTNFVGYSNNPAYPFVANASL